ncbi:MAG: hypothetical protein E6K78_01410 [Candidatus Eisenbacteria bacterium]|uniref:VOC domain-containing protein n=1 Tax=Eiseniibacteriota bacterium TaxID=2212470 RepID=A0A538TXJ2_UNCEI|nr:MAG: hypothetical protein E6K78_01410 [Candidatus Eisenbacteria bacterium]
MARAALIETHAGRAWGVSALPLARDSLRLPPRTFASNMIPAHPALARSRLVAHLNCPISNLKTRRTGANRCRERSRRDRVPGARMVRRRGEVEPRPSRCGLAQGPRRVVHQRRPNLRDQAAAASSAAPPLMLGPSQIGCASQHMDYTSHAMDEVKRFYTEMLGFSNFEHDPKINYLFVATGPSSSLGFMPPVPGPPELWRPPREPAIYLMVRNVDRAHADLVARGAMFQQSPTDMPWGHRVAILRDPEGRTVCLAEQRSRANP